MHHAYHYAALMLGIALGGCATGERKVADDDSLITTARVTTHRDGDDLLSAGLGLEGLKLPTTAALANPNEPTAVELRRRAIHSNWRGIADFTTGKGIGRLSAGMPMVPGREWSALATLPGRHQPHRLLVQVPDAFDAKQRCLVVTASSGSRGVYGAIAVAGGWGLPLGCAVAYTDKGAGTGFFNVDSGEGAALDGTRALQDPLEFRPELQAGAVAPMHAVAIKHAHSRDNPEADWGQHVLQAARFGLQALDEAFPAQAPFTAANTRVIAVGLSNAGGAVLRAAEQDSSGLFDAVIAVAPNIAAPSQGRVLFDYVTDAALYGACALGAIENPVAMLPPAVRPSVIAARCASLKDVGLLTATDLAGQSREALAHLRAGGWSDGAFALYEQNIAFDLWRAVAATYAQSYARAGVTDPVCGYSFAVPGEDAHPRAALASERALWWSDASGIAPTAGVAIVDANAHGADPAFTGLRCLRALWDGDDAIARRVRESVQATRGNARPLSPHVQVIHGIDDALLPIDFSSRAYVQAVRDNGIAIGFTEVPDAQHFDAFLAFPSMARYQPLIPFAYRALDEALGRQ